MGGSLRSPFVLSTSLSLRGERRPESSLSLGVSHSWERENAPGTLCSGDLRLLLRHGAAPFMGSHRSLLLPGFLSPKAHPSLAGWFATSTVNVQGLFWEEAVPGHSSSRSRVAGPSGRQAPALTAFLPPPPEAAQAPAQQLLKETNSSLYPLPPIL